MTFPDFDKMMDRYYAKMVEMRKTKGKEYANSETDRLANFKEIAKEVGVSPELVLIIYSKKHSRAIDSYCRTGKTHSVESIQGRITDRILYDFLLLGIVEDKENERGTKKPRGFVTSPVSKTDARKKRSKRRLANL